MEFDIRIKIVNLYDYMLYHAYTSFGGVLSVFIGIIILVGYTMNNNKLYILVGVILILYIPVTLYTKAAKQILANPTFKDDFHYIMNEMGIEIVQGDARQLVKWKDYIKVRSTFGSILLYTSKVNANILPKAQLGDQYELVVKMISTHIAPSKVKIR